MWTHSPRAITTWPSDEEWSEGRRENWIDGWLAFQPVSCVFYGRMCHSEMWKVTAVDGEEEGVAQVQCHSRGGSLAARSHRKSFLIIFFTYFGLFVFRLVLCLLRRESWKTLDAEDEEDNCERKWESQQQQDGHDTIRQLKAIIKFTQIIGTMFCRCSVVGFWRGGEISIDRTESVNLPLLRFFRLQSETAGHEMLHSAEA